MSLEQKLNRLEEILKHPVEVEKTLHDKYICTFLSYGAKMSSLVGDTEEDAVDKLLAYLSTAEYPQD